MCQPISGEMLTLKETKAWKVIHGDDPKFGPFYTTEFQKNGWSKPVQPKKHTRGNTPATRRYETTKSGYHVFKSFKDADKYVTIPGEKVITVQIRGKAIPFKDFGLSGWAVEQWKPIK